MKPLKDKERFGGNGIKALERDGFACVKCHMTNDEHIKRFNRSITVDHIDGNGRYADKQNNAIDNLQTLCLPCHTRKDAHYKLSDTQVQEVRDRCAVGFLQRD